MNSLSKINLLVLIGVVYIWFGALKLFVGVSPAESIAFETISVLTFHIIPQATAVKLLAIIEVVIGLFCSLVELER